MRMKIEGHCDPDADIAWLRLEAYDARTVVSEETAIGLRDLDPTTGSVVGLEYWRASESLPRDFLAVLPPPLAAHSA
jgi:uncharacterized protein YuzE